MMNEISKNLIHLYLKLVNFYNESIVIKMT